jgi:S-adenosyl methyltransferase
VPPARRCLRQSGDASASAGGFKAPAVLSRPANAQAIAATQEILKEALGSGVWRSNEEILTYFGDLALIEPGLVPLVEWRPAPGRTPFQYHIDADQSFVGGWPRRNDASAVLRVAVRQPARLASKWPDQAGTNRPYTDFYRVMWRYMIPDDTDRSLFPAIFPPGTAHIHGVRSLGMSAKRDTVLIVGFWAGLPNDYLRRIAKSENFDVANARTMPALEPDHPLATPLLLRTLRLNCLTAAYADLWAELCEDSWRDEAWVVDWPRIAPLSDVGPEWEYATGRAPALLMIPPKRADS